MNILPVVFKQICQFSTLNFSKGHTFLEILLPDLSPLWTPVLENMNLFSVQFCKGNNLSWGPCDILLYIYNIISKNCRVFHITFCLRTSQSCFAITVAIVQNLQERRNGSTFTSSS